MPPTRCMMWCESEVTLGWPQHLYQPPHAAHTAANTAAISAPAPRAAISSLKFRFLIMQPAPTPPPSQPPPDAACQLLRDVLFVFRRRERHRPGSHSGWEIRVRTSVRITAVLEDYY